MSKPSGNSPARVLAASLIGTAIEFFDFYIYATAAVLVFPQLFFADPSTALLASMATFALAFVARPLGSALFGHFGDRVGRKATLVAALLTMGLSTVIIGLLPTYHQIGILAPVLLALCRLGQGIGLGGEWGGAVLLATENAPPGKRAWYGMFPQLGAPIGFICSGSIFLLLGATLNEEQFFRFGWRIPFLASALLVLLGLWIRLKLEETPVFQKTIDKGERVEIPMAAVFRDHARALVLGTLLAILVFVLFYLMTVFTLGWGTTQLGYTRTQFLLMQIFGMLFFGAAIPLSAVLADKYGRRVTQLGAGAAIFVFGLVFSRLFHAGDFVSTSIFLAVGLALMGLCYGPLGTTLSELFPTAVRYTGSSLTFNLAGIFGASLAPYIAFWLAPRHGLASVGWYLSAAAVISLAALWMTRETKDQKL